MQFFKKKKPVLPPVEQYAEETLLLFARKVYAFCHINKSGGYNGEDDKGHERPAEQGSIYEMSKKIICHQSITY